MRQPLPHEGQPPMPPMMTAAAQRGFDLPGNFAPFPADGPSEAQNSVAHQQLMDSLLQSIQQSPRQHAFSHFTPQEGFSHAPLASGSSGMVTDYRGGDTGSTSFSVDGTWDDNEFAFTPLVSPAMTPLSALLSPQVQALKNGGTAAHVSPAEVFSPLTSPALQPQDAHMTPAELLQSPHLAQLAEQAAAMGLDGFQLPRSMAAEPGMSGPLASPPITGRGRGASRTSTKSRPSPIMKPLNRISKTSSFSQPVTPSHPPESLPSTPSPIDIDIGMAVAQTHADFMPPPPLPPHANVPATPSSLMNLGLDGGSMNGLDMSQGGSSTSTSPMLGPKRGGSPKKQSKNGNKSNRNSVVDFAPLPASVILPPEDRRNSHRAAEQRRRDSLKLCFEELRPLLPHIPPEEDEEALASKRPGEGNVAGQRTSGVDPLHPNKGVSKVALLRKSNAYIQALEQRIRSRDEVLLKLKRRYGIAEEELRIEDWEENWPWNGAPGDEGHSPYSQAAIQAQALANGDLDGSKKGAAGGIVTRNRSKRNSQVLVDSVGDCLE